MKKRIDEHFLKHEPEGECFDVKSARIKPADLAEVLIAFANTKGGNRGNRRQRQKTRH